MKSKSGLSEAEWFFLAASLLYSVSFIPFWPHSLVFGIPIFLYIGILGIPFIKGITLLGFSFAFYFCWEYLSSFWVTSLNIQPSLDFYRFFLQEKLSKIIESRYPGETGDFVNYLLFNKRASNLKTLFEEFNELSVKHLLVVSGMHMNIVKKVISVLGVWIPFQVVRKGLTFCVLSAYSWATAFSVPSSRVFLEEVGELTSKKGTPSPIIRWSKSVWLSCFLFPHSINSLGFALSYSLSLVFRLIDKLGFSNIKSVILKTVTASLMVLFVFSYKTRKLFPLACLNQLFLTPIVTFIFLFFFMSWPFSFLGNSGIQIYEFFKSFISKLGLNRSYIERAGGSFLEPFYFTFAFSLVGLALTWLLLPSKKKEFEEEEVFQLSSKIN